MHTALSEEGPELAKGNSEREAVLESIVAGLEDSPGNSGNQRWAEVKSPGRNGRQGTWFPGARNCGHDDGKDWPVGREGDPRSLHCALTKVGI